LGLPHDTGHKLHGEWVGRHQDVELAVHSHEGAGVLRVPEEHRRQAADPTPRTHHTRNQARNTRLGNALFIIYKQRV